MVGAMSFHRYCYCTKNNKHQLRAQSNLQHARAQTQLSPSIMCIHCSSVHDFIILWRTGAWLCYHNDLNELQFLNVATDTLPQYSSNSTATSGYMFHRLTQILSKRLHPQHVVIRKNSVRAQLAKILGNSVTLPQIESTPQTGTFVVSLHQNIEQQVLNWLCLVPLRVRPQRREVCHAQLLKLTGRYGYLTVEKAASDR